MDFANWWVAEYSAQQGCFNVATLGKALQANAMMVQGQSNNDYLIFGMYATSDEAHAACDRMRQEQTNGRAQTDRFSFGRHMKRPGGSLPMS